MIGHSLYAQYTPLVEEGKFWIYRNYEFSDMPQSVSGHAISFLGDTIVNAVAYKKVYRINLKGSQNCPPSEQPCWEFDIPYEEESKEIVSFIREDVQAKKVYNLPNANNLFCGVNEYLLFDFSLDVGDTLNSCIYQNILATETFSSPGGIVDSIKTVDSHGALRRTLFSFGFNTIIGLPFETKLMVAEGLGFENFGIFMQSLTEFSDYCEGSLGQCALLLSNDINITKQDIFVYPNPSIGLVQVSNNLGPIKSISAYSPTGLLVKESKSSYSIDLSGLINGVYIVDIILSNDSRVIRKVVKGF